MAILIDTSLLIEIERRPEERSALTARLGDEAVGIAAITASELLHGVHRTRGAQRRALRERFVEGVLSSVTTFPFDLEVARVHSRIWADLARHGERIGAHDLMIAATALHHELRLWTRNPDEFRRVEGLKLIDES